MHFSSVNIGLLVWGLTLSNELYAANQWSVATGIDASTGRYGLAENTHIQAEYIQIRYEKKDWLLKADLPYLHITGPSNARFVSDETVIISNTSNTKRHIEGWGDVTLSATKAIWTNNTAHWGIDLTTKVKLPTASQRNGLSSGERDHTLQLDGYKAIGKTSLFSSLGYKWMGKPSGVDYRDVMLASAGVAYQLSSPLTLGIALDYRQSPTRYLLDQTEWMLFVSKRLTPKWKMQAYLYRGTNEASPDIGVGMMTSWVF